MVFAHWRLLYFAFVFALGGGLLDSFSLECWLVVMVPKRFACLVKGTVCSGLIA